MAVAILARAAMLADPAGGHEVRRLRGLIGDNRHDEVLEQLRQTVTQRLTSARSGGLGLTTVVAGGPARALQSFVEAAQAVATGRQSRLIVASANILQDGATAKSNAGPTPAEACAALCLAHIDDPAMGPRVQLESVTAAGHLATGDWRALIDGALARADIDAATILQAISATADPQLGLAEVDASSAALPENVPVLQLAWRCGNTGAALGLLALCSALEDPLPAIVTAADTEQSTVVVLA